MGEPATPTREQLVAAYNLAFAIVNNVERDSNKEADRG